MEERANGSTGKCAAQHSQHFPVSRQVQRGMEEKSGILISSEAKQLERVKV